MSFKKAEQQNCCEENQNFDLIDWQKFDYSPNNRCEWCREISSVLNRVYKINIWSKFYLRYMCTLCILNKNRRNTKYLESSKKCTFL